MVPTHAVRPNASESWTVSGDASAGLSYHTEGRNWLNAVIASGHSATAAVRMLVDGQEVARVTLRAGQAWSPSLAAPHPLPPGAVIAFTSDEIAYVSAFGFRAP